MCIFIDTVNMVATELAGIADAEEDGSDYKRHLKLFC